MNSDAIAAGCLALKIPREVAGLITALRMREPDQTILATLSDAEWTNLLTFCEIAHLTLPLAQLPCDGFPSWVTERLKVNVADNAQRFERVKATYMEAAEALRTAGVDHVVLKGFTQAPEFVHDPRLRLQSDIDLYCPSYMIEAGRIALQGIGYALEGKIDYSRADHIPTMLRLGSWQWRGNHFDPEMPLSIELHFCLWNEDVMFFQMPGVDEFWERRTVRSVDGLSFSSLSLVDQLGYLSLHILRNILPGHWVIHHVHELATFLHSHASDDAFWTSWSETHEPALREFEAVAFFYAQAWFDCDLHPQVAAQIVDLPRAQRRWLHQFVGSTLESMFQQNKDSVWLHLSYADRLSAKATLLRRAFIPGHISSINSPAVETENRRPRLSRAVHPYRRYLSYLGSRIAAYGYLNMRTLLRGFRWRFGYRQFVK